MSVGKQASLPSPEAAAITFPRAACSPEITTFVASLRHSEHLASLHRRETTTAPCTERP